MRVGRISWGEPVRREPGVCPRRLSVKPIRIVVASSPGTADDFFARSLAGELEAKYRQRIVIDNRSGAGGLIGNTVVSKSNADGYTLV